MGGHGQLLGQVVKKCGSLAFIGIAEMRRAGFPLRHRGSGAAACRGSAQGTALQAGKEGAGMLAAAD